MLIDLLCLMLLALAIFKGISKGFIVAVFSCVAYFIGIIAALKLSATVANMLHKKMNWSGYWLPGLSFLLVFVAVAFGIRYGGGLLKKLAGFAMMGWLDKLLGVLLYAIAYMMISSVVLYFATRIYLISDKTKAESKTYAYLSPVAPKVIEGIGKAIPFCSNIFTQLGSYFESVAKKQHA